MKVVADIFTTVKSEENTFILHSGGNECKQVESM